MAVGSLLIVFLAYLQTQFPLPFLACDELLGLFGRSPAAARSAYRAFVLDGLVPVSDTAVLRAERG